MEIVGLIGRRRSHSLIMLTSHPKALAFIRHVSMSRLVRNWDEGKERMKDGREGSDDISLQPIHVLSRSADANK